MLSIMNEIDPCLLLPLCVLYEIQNQIYQKCEPIIVASLESGRFCMKSLQGTRSGSKIYNPQTQREPIVPT